MSTLYVDSIQPKTTGQAITVATTNQSLGKILQVKHFQTGEVVTGTITTPGDDTIPQLSETNPMMELSITPTSATSNLLVQVVFNGNRYGANHSLLVTLFRDSGTEAIALSTLRANGQTHSDQNIALNYQEVAGSTSETTFKVNASASTSGGTVVMNGFPGSSGRGYGGAFKSTITIMEISA